MFDFKKYLIDFNIPIPDISKNTGSGWINIKCPFCDDAENHLGFNLTENYFTCWKCGHKSIYDIIQKLTPQENTKSIINKYETNQINIDKIKKKINIDKIILPGNKLQFCHKKYLFSRGLDPDYIEEKYKLQGTLYNAKYPYKLIIPVIENSKIVTYQTRGLLKKERYINCEPEKEIKPIKDCLYNIDNCNNNYVIVTEGVFKVLKLGNNVCATFGKNFTHKQIQILQRFKKIFIYFDPDQAGIDGAKKLSSLLDCLGIDTFIINNKYAADDLSENQIKLFWDNFFTILNKKRL